MRLTRPIQEWRQFPSTKIGRGLMGGCCISPMLFGLFYPNHVPRVHDGVQVDADSQVRCLFGGYILGAVFGLGVEWLIRISEP